MASLGYLLDDGDHHIWVKWSSFGEGTGRMMARWSTLFCLTGDHQVEGS